MRPTLDDLQTLALQAGDILRAGFRRQELKVQHKGVIDLVTEVDHLSENFLISEIRRRFPGHGIVAEESGSLAGNGSGCWYIDPLDGTVNYAHGLPFFSVSIGYAEDGVLQLGAIYDPSHDELFSAVAGKGAYLNASACLLASLAPELDQALLVTGFPYDVRTNPENNLGNYARFAVRSRGVRRLGSAALDLCYVAAGRFDGYWEMHVKPWDVAAGVLIAREAGAMVTGAAGEAEPWKKPGSVLAANATLHAQILEVLRQRPPVDNIT